MPNWFKKWYARYGGQNDFPAFVDTRTMRRIAWRAYRKGKKDGKNET